ncbi:DOMON domain-containing protein FRRS1L-like [Babylonia areolata]|uniref:DOMON domain-containing protein FRRS1L-like n=1 Tax=Babylonia areolata TaxID=304850 RepID=UPI003FD6ABF0
MTRNGVRYRYNMTRNKIKVEHDAHPTGEGLAAVRSTENCGLTRTCIRYGREGCGHLSCDYMLSYVVNNTDVDLQMSARGTGWVAVGFSSDKFMGGGDDVIVCKRERKPSSRVVSLSLGNTVKHTRPQVKTNRLTLLEGLLQDGHIYCRLTRPLEFPKRLADSDLDLFNDWHQLYAYGDIDGTLRHFLWRLSDLPPFFCFLLPELWSVLETSP